MYRMIHVVCLACCLFFAAVTSSGADQKELNYHASGLEVPRVYLVEGFFAVSKVMLSHPDSSFQEWYLEQLGIPLGSDAEWNFRDAVLSAHELRGVGTLEVTQTDGVDGVEVAEAGPYPLGKPSESPEEFSARKAVDLANIYSKLTRDLAASGIAPSVIERFIEQEIAPGSGWSSNKPMTESQAIRAFEDQLRVKE